MAVAQQLQHRSIRDTALAYNSYGSPTKAQPCYLGGSNVLTSQREYAELRPGYDAFEPTPTAFTDTLTRLYLWHRWDDTFYGMLSTYVSGAQHVYKLRQGADSSYVDLSITNLTTVGTAYPVDFVSSNNTLFMSAGDSSISHKWDATTVSRWGISVGAISTAPQNTAGAGGNDGSSGAAWTNPSNVTSAVNYATVSIAAYTYSQWLDATSFGFSLGASDSIVGIQVDFTAQGGGPVDGLYVQLLKGGVRTGTAKVFVIGVTSGDPSWTAGGASDLWGETWTYNDANATNFGVAFEAWNHTGTYTLAVRDVKITIYKLGGPTVTVSGTSGSMSASYGYQYVYCYGNSNTGHISSPTPASASTGAFTSKASVGVDVVASTDPQVNQIRVFRTTDGGGGIYFELPNSPFANTTATITDSAADADLSIVVAPIAGFNDPPPLGLQGMVWFQNRIWGFLNASSFVYFSGWEEINIGVEEECWPSGTTGNSIAADDVVKALASTSDYLFIFTPVSIHKIEGDSLDTFRRSYLVKNMGCRSRTNVATLGRSVAFINVDNTVWTTDGTSLTEIGQPIRNDIASLDQTKSSLVFYNYGVNHWLMLTDGANSRQYVYDLDTEQWMPPWNLAMTPQSAAASGTVTTSGESTLGVQKVLLATATKVLNLDPAVYTDNGTNYAASATTNLFDLVPGTIELATGSYGIGAPAGHIGELEYLSVETNAVQPDSIRVLIDDDPYQGVFSKAEWANPRKVAPHRSQGEYLFENWWYFRMNTGRRAALNFTWNATGKHFKLYSYDLAFKPMEQ